MAPVTFVTFPRPAFPRPTQAGTPSERNAPLKLTKLTTPRETVKLDGAARRTAYDGGAGFAPRGRARRPSR